jgi:hypothetical protein
MDPISIIVTALIAGAAAALKPMTEQAIKDAYTGMKGLIQRKFGRVDVAVLETDPASKMRQGVLKEDLEKAGAGQDEELLREAKALLEAVQAHASAVQAHASDEYKAIGLDLEDIKAASLSAENILAKGSYAIGIKVKGGEFQGDIKASGVRASSASSEEDEGETPKKA